MLNSLGGDSALQLEPPDKGGVKIVIRKKQVMWVCTTVNVIHQLKQSPHNQQIPTLIFQEPQIIIDPTPG